MTDKELVVELRRLADSMMVECGNDPKSVFANHAATYRDAADIIERHADEDTRLTDAEHSILDLDNRVRVLEGDKR